MQRLIHIYFEGKDYVLVLQLCKLRHRNLKQLAEDTQLAEGRPDSPIQAEWLQSHGQTIKLYAGFASTLLSSKLQEGSLILQGVWLSYSAVYLQHLLEGLASSQGVHKLLKSYAICLCM